jgi:TonB family protein
MEQNFNSPESGNDPKPDRSLMYFAIILGLIVLVMGYLTFYIDDVGKIFTTKEEGKVLVKVDSSEVLSERFSMSEEEVKNSLIKFIEVFYSDQKKGYFDPPSYFPPITQTYYNFHNLTYQRIKEVHWKRLSDMKDLELSWDVSSLEFERNGNELVANYLTRVTYYQPSRNQDVNADIRCEISINEEGKISSLREIEILNLVETPRSYQNDSSSVKEGDRANDSRQNSKDVQPISDIAKADQINDAKLYDFGNVEIVPEYRGGQKALAIFLASRLKYPAKAKQNKTQGKVYVTFIIEKNGSIGDFKIIRGLGNGCDEEAIRVLKLSPSWKPGYVNGVPVRTSYTIPIIFKSPN